MRLGISGATPPLPRVEVCANLAVQFARLRQRTLVLDLDPSLPNVGFRLGLDPKSYLAHLKPDATPQLERSVMGLRIVVGVAGRPRSAPLPEDLEAEIRDSDCVLVFLPPRDEPLLAELQHWVRPVRSRAAPTTLERAAAGSPMFDAWMATVRRDDRRPAAHVEAAEPQCLLDAMLCVRGPSSTPEEALPRRLAELIAPTPVHALVWGEPQPLGPAPLVWARVPPHASPPAARQPLSSLYPEHPVSRLYESLAQALLAGLGGRAIASA